jgi:thiol-disulfide isomerase/thioredoxin
MTRILTAAVVAALIAAPALRADDAKSGDVKSNRLDQVKAIQQEFTKAQQEFAKKFQAAKTPQERQELNKERPAPAPFVAKAEKIIDADAKDEAGFEALMFAVQNSQVANGKHLELLAEHHATNPKIGRACMRAMSGRGLSPQGEKLLGAVLANNKNKEPLGFANYAMAQAKQRTGKDADALPYLEKIEKHYADVEIAPGRRLGQMVKGTIFAIRNLAIGKTVPEVVSKDLDDQKVDLKSLRGKVVVLDFWATWCPPCRASIPHSNELVKKMKDKPFVFVSVSSDAKKDTLTAFLKTNEMPWTHWWEGVGDTTLSQVWGVTGIPTVYVIDAKGVIRHKEVGFSAAATEKNEAFDKLIEDLVKEAEAKN